VTERRRGAGVWIATCLGVGYFPIAPGTAGSVVGVVLVAVLGLLPLTRAGEILLAVLFAAALLVLGVWAAGQAEDFFGRVDPGQVVIDEVVGQMITLLLCARASWMWLLAGFLFFRFFDIAKPFPVRQAERFPRGWGIMLDDVLAGVYGLAMLWLVGLVWK
jgi:phosphatidylglycerophosphatase A